MCLVQNYQSLSAPVIVDTWLCQSRQSLPLVPAAAAAEAIGLTRSGGGAEATSGLNMVGLGICPNPFALSSAVRCRQERSKRHPTRCHNRCNLPSKQTQSQLRGDENACWLKVASCARRDRSAVRRSQPARGSGVPPDHIAPQPRAGCCSRRRLDDGYLDKPPSPRFLRSRCLAPTTP